MKLVTLFTTIFLYSTSLFATSNNLVIVCKSLDGVRETYLASHLKFDSGKLQLFSKENSLITEYESEVKCTIEGEKLFDYNL